MPRNMAMERPNTGIVRGPLNDHMARISVATTLEQVDITTLRIERVSDGAIPRTGTFSQDLEIVTV